MVRQYTATIICVILSLSLVHGIDIEYFLKLGEKELKLARNNTEAIIIIGNTGSGKSSLAHFVAGDLSTLRSVLADEATSDYIIQDLDDRISNGSASTVSHTIFPELHIDSESLVWYDCPGFSDTRNTSMEIVNAYFIKKVVNNIQNIKILLIVNHDSVKSAGHRSDFHELLKQSTQLIKNVGRYRLSVGLIVGKVISYVVKGKKVEDVDKYKVIASVATFIENHRKTLEGSENAESQLHLIDALLQRSSSGNYTQIDVFLRPDEENTLDKIPKMVTNKESIREMVKQRMKFISARSEDFGYTLSGEAENDITHWSQEKKKKSLDSIKAVANKISLFYRNKYSSVKYFSDRLKLVETNLAKYAILSEIKNSQGSTVRQYLNALSSVAQNDDIPFEITKELDDLTLEQTYVSFLSTISANVQLLSPLECHSAFQICLDSIQTERNWNNFLIDFFTFLSDHNVQRDRTRFNVANINDWNQPNKPQGLTITNSNFHSIIETQRGYGELLKDIEPTTEKLNDINDVIQVTLKSKNEIVCSEGQMIIKGEFIRSNELNAKKCSGSIKKIHLYVLNTFFADTDLNLVDFNGEVVIMTNKYENVANVKFSLEGNTGGPPDPPAKTDSVLLTAPQGHMGHPGGNGSNFFVMAKDFVSDKGILTLNLTGGNGGAGQDASEGYVKKFDGDAILRRLSSYDLKIHHEGDEESWAELFAEFNTQWTTCEVIQVSVRRKRQLYPPLQDMNHLIRVETKHWPNNAPGHGGVYGRHGTVQVLPLLKNIEVNKHFHIIAKDGVFGSNGTEASCTIWRAERDYSPRHTPRKRAYSTTCNKRAKENYDVNIQEKIPLSDAQLLLNDYKTYIREHINDKNRIKDLAEFHREIGESNIPLKTIP